MSENFEQLVNDSVQKPLYPGALVEAEVLEIDKTKRYVMLDGGLKSESRVPLNEFLGKNGELEIEVNDKVTVVIEALEDGFGESLLSREKAKRMAAWDELQHAFDNKEMIQGVVTGRVKGGFTVDIGALQGFLPGSLVDTQSIVDPTFIEGKELEFKVITLDPRRNNIVLSRRAALEVEGQAAREKRLEELYEGQILTCTVKNLVDYGAFMNLGGGIDGLLHINSMTWEKRDPKEILEPNAEVKVVILKLDKKDPKTGKPRISLGMKQLHPEKNPWRNFTERYSVGMRLEKRKVLKVESYGCFIEIEPAIHGLVHVSQMDWTNRNPNPHTVIQREQDEEGRIDVVILNMKIDEEKGEGRVELGIKQTKENPWETFEKNHQPGEQVRGKIRSVTELGLFVQLFTEAGSIDGLVHHSEITNNLSGDAAIRQFKKGEEVDVVILYIDPARERIALSMRQASKTGSSDSTENAVSNDENLKSSTLDTEVLSSSKVEEENSLNESATETNNSGFEEPLTEDSSLTSLEAANEEVESILDTSEENLSGEIEVEQTTNLEDFPSPEEDDAIDIGDNPEELANIEKASLPDQLIETEEMEDSLDITGEEIDEDFEDIDLEPIIDEANTEFTENEVDSEGDTFESDELDKPLELEDEDLGNSEAEEDEESHDQ